MSELLSQKNLPAWFSYPDEFLNLVDEGQVDIGPWQILLGKWLVARFAGMRQRYPDCELIPFARRLDCDDVACWDKSSPGAIFVTYMTSHHRVGSRGRFILALLSGIKRLKMSWNLMSKIDAQLY